MSRPACGCGPRGVRGTKAEPVGGGGATGLAVVSARDVETIASDISAGAETAGGGGGGGGGGAGGAVGAITGAATTGGGTTP